MNVMDRVTENPGATGRASLAVKRAEVTRNAIRTAVADLLEHEHPATISVPDVARRSGISVRTIYRYFPTKQALIDDVATAVFDRVSELGEPPDGVTRDPGRWVPALWGEFARDISSIRAQHASPAGAELRARRLRKSRDVLMAQLRSEHPEAADEDLTKFADVIIAVTSSRMFLELHDRMGWPVDEAIDISMWIVRALQHQFRAGGTP